MRTGQKIVVGLMIAFAALLLWDFFGSCRAGREPLAWLLKTGTPSMLFMMLLGLIGVFLTPRSNVYRD